jgi:hypothetical protein
MYLDWPFAIFNTAIGVVGFGFGYVAYLITQKISSTPLKIILSGPFWLASVVFVVAALVSEMWHMFGPFINFVLSFF